MAAMGAFLVEAGKQILIAVGIDVGRDIADKGKEKADDAIRNLRRKKKKRWWRR